MSRELSKDLVSCDYCKNLKANNVILKCSRCLTTYYCDKTCQRADWSRHKNECGKINHDKDSNIKKITVPNLNTTYKSPEKFQHINIKYATPDVKDVSGLIHIIY